MPARIDLTGQRFGRWLVLGRGESYRRQACWLCRCDCGEERAIRGATLTRGASRSCGCLNSEITTARNLDSNPSSRMPDAEITYKAAHYRVYRAKGAASSHTCVDCAAGARDWSLRHDAPAVHWGENRGSACRYSGNPDDYDPRCVPCHRTYDRTVTQIIRTDDGPKLDTVTLGGR